MLNLSLGVWNRGLVLVFGNWKQVIYGCFTERACVGGSAVNRWPLALLLVLLWVAAAFLPLIGSLFELSPAGVNLSSEHLPIYVKSDAARAGDRVRYVPGELLVKFVRGASANEIASLRVGQGAEEVYVSPFSSVRTWRVPPAKSVEEWVQVLGKNPLVEYAEPHIINPQNSNQKKR
jgi:hypothetical protein